jgi:uncharacterized protein (TIGR01244 family)
MSLGRAPTVAFGREMSGMFRQVDDGFWVSPQIAPADIEAVRALGVRVIVNNRPDGEQPGQVPGAEIQAAAEAAGLGYVAAPVRGGPTEETVQAMTQALAEGPVLAYCMSGTRSILVWAIAQIIAGARTRDETVALARNAGFDLSRWI